MKTKRIKNITLIAGIFLFTIIIRVCFVEIYSVTGDSMENTLLAGDKILVNKAVYGARMPSSPYEIPWINLFCHVAGVKSFDWGYHRLKGYSDYKRGDVMVFTNPLFNLQSDFFIKRCTALPGDTLLIKNGLVKVNGLVQYVPAMSKNTYRINIHNTGKFNSLTDSLGIRSIKSFDAPRSLAMTLTYRQQQQIKNHVDSVFIRTDRDNCINPEDSLFQWTRNNYGPLVIPRKGMTVPMDKYHCFLYEKTIRYFEKQPVEWENGQYYINDSIITNYTFRHNYFFMMGDNRVSSSDCLDWGFFIPEENIAGKVSVVLYSYKKGKGFTWKRLLKNTQ
ncbi:MAG: signal peptidase I [Tannerella sp.]|jgi:signal peptidase I|nr:signal peptidase I [Tannerella sp.]